MAKKTKAAMRPGLAGRIARISRGIAMGSTALTFRIGKPIVKLSPPVTCRRAAS
jgi:hypothetical protein